MTISENSWFKFNTGRLYTKDGQVIYFVIDALDYEAEVATVSFDDRSRGISGSVQVPLYDTSPAMLARNVLAAYDRGDYQWHYTRDIPKQFTDLGILG